jgi:TetR/AcrR family transcriptional repressor of nem operon
MRYSPEHREKTRDAILKAAGRQFREHGFSGIGVDALAKEAGVTSGAFYAHFGSKADAFRAVVVQGLKRLYLGAEGIRGQHGRTWLDALAAFYLGPDHRRDVRGGCVLPSLSAEIAHADSETRKDYQAELLEVAALVADGLPGTSGREAAWPVLAMLAGGVLLSRAVQDESIADEIARSVLRDLSSEPPDVPKGRT